MTPTDVRVHLATNGFTPIPCNGKAPVLKEWQKRTETSAGDIDIWATTYPNARNTGILCAHTPTLDIDVLDERAVDAAVALVRERFEGRGRIMERRGQHPKLAILFRGDAPFKKKRVMLTAPNGSAGEKVELLCEDQQVIVDGIHPDTHEPYQWRGGDPHHVRHDELPPITEAEARALVDDIVALMVQHGYQTADERKPNGNGHGGDGVDWGRLHENIRAGRDYHETLRDLACSMIAAGTAPGAVVNQLRALMRGSEAPHDARWQSRYDDIQRLVDTAEDLVRKGRADQPKDIDAEVARLAKLSLLEYEQQRKLVAEELDIRASVLDRLVTDKRAALGLGEGTDDRQGKPIEFPKIEPWHEEVNGAELLDEIAREIARYMIMSDSDKTVAAIWPVHAYVYSRFIVSPRLCVRSPVKECGKTTLFSVLGHLVPRALTTSSVTPAVIFRMIGLHHPTVLIDEAAGMFDEEGEVRRILNAGYRAGGTVMRCVGDSFEPRQFDVFGPVAFALIGTLPSDLHSRCICVNLRRKLRGEKVEPDRIGQMGHLDALARKIARWTDDNADAIVSANPDLPAAVVNRRGDLWVVMLSIAKVAGGDWPVRVERAIAATAEIGDDDAALLEKLLADIKVVFDEKGDEISSEALVNALVDMEGRPWPELGKSRKPLTKTKLAHMLHVPGVSVSPGQVKGGKLRGYQRSQFDDIFARYLDTYYPSKCRSVGDPMKTEGTDTSQSVCDSVCDVSEVSATDTPPDASTDTSDTLDTSIDTSESGVDPMEIGVTDTLTLPGVVSVPLSGMLEPARVRQLIDWYRKQAKALRTEMSPGSLPAYLRQKLRETLAEELVAELVDDTANKIAKAATPKKRKSR
jgi:putative DNA primase/helicase